MQAHIFKGLFVLLAIISSSAAFPLLWPLPHNATFNTSATPVKISPCDVNFAIDSPIQPYIKNMLDWYLTQVFICSQKNPSNVTLNIIVPATTVNLPLETTQDSYSLIIRSSGKWELSSNQYTGFLRGLQTYSQLFEQKNTDYFIQGIPIVIDDQPQFKWRGLMIDSSRHFLPVAAIKKTIDGLMYNKMNILHWHIIDEDSFPMEIMSVPELSASGQIGGTYSQSEIKDIVSYAKIRGVRVVVEIDTPAHTQSWGRSDRLKQIVVKCNAVYSGQFDPTLDLTYEVVNDVMNYVNQVFEDPYVHFGGDETVESCWDLRPAIKAYMIAHGIKTYKQLSTMYRQKQKTLWRKITPTKKAIYWANQAIDLALEKDDVLQWWGLTSHLSNLVGRPNQIILSNYDLTYLDVGFGNRNGRPYQTYIRWRDVYKFSPRYQGVNIIGGETCMWSELNNVHTQDQKVWTRTSVLSERLWNDKIDLSSNLQDIARRLVAQARRMKKRGFKTSPVTVQICEENMNICF